MGRVTIVIMQRCRLILNGDSPQLARYDGDENMAIDEALLRSAAEQDSTSLRFYGWKQPTVSLGYFQNLADRDSHSSSSHCNVVRRASGGGAIVHDRELTYCFTKPNQTRFGTEQELYVAFHETLVETLAERSVVCHLHRAEDGLVDEPFLCFQRRATGDVIHGKFKIGGSAQRRWKNAVMQHGSVLLAQSSHAPELPGLRDLAEFSETVTAFTKSWLEKLTSRLNIDVQESCLTDKELEGASRLRQEKFANNAWTMRR